MKFSMLLGTALITRGEKIRVVQYVQRSRIFRNKGLHMNSFIGLPENTIRHAGSVKTTGF